MRTGGQHADRLDVRVVLRLPGTPRDPVGEPLATCADKAHAVVMSQPSKYAVTLDELVVGVRVPLDEQVEEQDATEAPEHDESAGHLPGNVRPCGA